MAIPSSKNTLLLLLVAIAATFPHFSASSAFAQAEECKDKSWVGKIRKKGVKYQICDWVAMKKTKKRCKKIIKQKGVRKQKGGEKKKVVIEVKPWSYCGCVCKDYQPEEAGPLGESEDDSEDDSEEEPQDEASGEEKICPTDLLQSNEVRDAIEQRRSSTVKNNQDNVEDTFYADRSSFVTSVSTDCIRDGYEKWRTCAYEFIWTGCTYDDLICEPKYECTCAPDFVSDGKEWKCMVISYEQCEEPTRPQPGNPIPIGVPPMAGKTCVEGQSPPRPLQNQRSGILGI